MVTEADLELGDGRTLHVYDALADGAQAGLTVFWQHGTPNLGPPPAPLFPAAARLGIRWVSYDRPGYGRSTPHPGRDLAAAAAEVAAVADALGVGRFGVMGHSGGSVFALACGALLGERVLGVVCVAALAPFDAEGLDWFTGMAADAARLRAATRGRAALEAFLAASEFDPEEFTPADHAALAGAWSWLGEVAGQAQEGGLPGGMVDDELAYVGPWGFAPGQVRAPVLLVHGGQDRIAPSAHAGWLASRIPAAELWLRPEDGHISVLGSAEAALGWGWEHASQG